MKIKKFLSIILLFFAFFICEEVSADTWRAGIYCEKGELSEGDIVKCDVALSPKHMNYLELKNYSSYYFPGGMGSSEILENSYFRFEPNKNWDNMEIKNGNIVLTSENGVTGPFYDDAEGLIYAGSYYIKLGDKHSGSVSETIGVSFEKVMSDGYDIGIRTVEYDQIDYNEYNQSKLKSIYINNVEINPKFDPNTNIYNATINSDKIAINYEKLSLRSDVSIPTGKEYKLEYGSNKIEIVVKSSSGKKTTTYTLNINRPDNRGTNNKLASLTVNNQEVKLSDNKYYYSISLPYVIEEKDIKYKAQDSKATVTIDGPIKLGVGENLYTLKVTSENGISYDYLINIIREKRVLDTDATLKDIDVKGYYIDFDKEKHDYEIKINNDDESLEINATPNSSLAKVEIIGNKDLKDKSVIEIKVKAENGDNETYFITVKKEVQTNYSNIVIAVLSGVIILLTTYIIIDKFSSEKNNKTNKNDIEQYKY